MPKVCIITVNFGNPEDTVECFESIVKSTFQDYIVLCVDVCNKNNSIDILNSWYSRNDSRFIPLNINVNKGFAYANNIALKYINNHLSVDYIWLLNNDTVIDNEAIEILIRFHQKQSETYKTGIIGSKVKDYSIPAIQSVGGSFNKKTGYSKLIGKGEADKGQYDGQIIQPDYVIGASMFFKYDILNEIGLMPEDYFLYYEDIDWCISAKEKGFTHFTCADSIVLHKQGSSTGNKYNKKKSNLSTRKYMYKSYLILYRRHFRNFMYIAYLILFKQLVGKIFRLKFGEASVIARTLFWK